MRKLISKKFNKENIKNKLKKSLFATALSSSMLASLVGCGNNKTNTTTTTESTSVSTQATTEAKTEEPTTEVATEAKTEAPVELKGNLNINDNASIEANVDSIYESDKEFYDKNGIDKDTIRDMIFVINDKYEDEDGTPILDTDKIYKADASIQEIEYSFDFMLKVNQVTDGENEFELMKHPTLVPYVDLNLSGSEALVEEIKEFEEVRDYEIDYMNKNVAFDKDVVNNYVIKNEVVDIRKNKNNLDSFTKNGQQYVISFLHVAGLEMAASMNIDTLALTYEDEVININYTNAESDLVVTVETLRREGLLTPEAIDNAISFVEAYSITVTDDKELAKMYSERFGIELNYCNLLIAYAKTLIRQEVYGWNKAACSYENKAIEAVKSKKATLGKPKTLTLSTED